LARIRAFIPCLLPSLWRPRRPGEPESACAMSASPLELLPDESQIVGAGRGYIKVKDIGQGSYGKALLVRHREGGLYVMKTIDLGAMDMKQKQDAINEVRVLSSLKHPYIVGYKESFSENSSLAIVMDYADGGDLHQKVKRTRAAGESLSEQLVLRWFTQVALAIKYMHDKHVLHRDLKSQNLFLTSSGRLHVGDFGISKVLESTGAFTKTSIGTPYYLSPEICQEKPYSYASDIWALGVVLYEMCALKVPFDSRTLQGLVRKILRAPLPQFPPQYQEELQEISRDAMDRNPTLRPSATDIIQRRYVRDEILRMLDEERQKPVAVAPSQQPRSSSQPACVRGLSSRESEAQPASHRPLHTPAAARPS